MYIYVVYSLIKLFLCITSGSLNLITPVSENSCKISNAVIMLVYFDESLVVNGELHYTQ